MLTRTIIAWDLTGEATSLAYINLVVAIPMIFASLLGGAITDRVERRQLVIVGQCLIMANEIFILAPCCLAEPPGILAYVLCTAFVAGCAFPVHHARAHGDYRDGGRARRSCRAAWRSRVG